MIGFTERLERFGRAQTVQAKDWYTEDERFSMGGGGGSVVVVEELGLRWEVGGLGIWEIEGCRGEGERKELGAQGTRRNYVAPGTEYRYTLTSEPPRITGSPFSTAQLGLLLLPYKIILSRIPY